MLSSIPSSSASVVCGNETPAQLLLAVGNGVPTGLHVVTRTLPADPAPVPSGSAHSSIISCGPSGSTVSGRPSLNGTSQFAELLSPSYSAKLPFASSDA